MLQKGDIFLKVKVRVVTVQDEEKEKMSYDFADHAENETNINNKDELIEFLSNTIGSLKMQFSALKKEYDMLQKQYDGLKKTYEETKEKDAKFAFEMGQNLAGLYDQLHGKTADKVSKDIYCMKISNMEISKALEQKTIDYDVLKGEYDHLKAEFNKLYSQYLSYMDKIQKFITDIKGEATEKKGDYILEG